MSYLLDTNIVSEVRKPHGSPGVRAWLSSAPSSDVYLSVLVVGEIRQGIERLRHRDSVQASLIEAWLTQLQRDYADRILPVSTAVADRWGRLNASDGLLVATALVHDLTLVTRNVADVSRTGVRLLNPFDL